TPNTVCRKYYIKKWGHYQPFFTHFSDEISSSCSHKNMLNNEMFCTPLFNRVFFNEKRILIFGE
ncbi:MAG: hypothetical protein LBR55_00095, partial [Bacteroidales bacterium]|nr:hypothetical protein [Bacteroidales bacterium]